VVFLLNGCTLILNIAPNGRKINCLRDMYDTLISMQLLPPTVKADVMISENGWQSLVADDLHMKRSEWSSNFHLL
jgi:hypothetical protein